MKAFLWEGYGPPKQALRMAEVEKPVPRLDEVLVRVLGVSVNPADWHSMRGKPMFSRLTLGLLRPKHKILGVDVAGLVEEVGGRAGRWRYQRDPPLPQGYTSRQIFRALAAANRAPTVTEPAT